MKKINIILLFAFSIFYTSLFAQADNVIVHADQMPYFSGCKKYKNGTEKKRKCSNEFLVAFLSNHLEYPDSAKAMEIEGTVYVSFIIDEEGRVIEPSIIRDIGNGCGEAAIAVVKKMPNWQPGMNNGKPVKVKLNLPIQFYLKKGVPTSTEYDDYKITWGTLKGNKVAVDDLKENLNKVIMVRNRFGEPVSFDELTFSYKRKRQFQTATSNGLLDKKQKRIIKKAKAGGKFYIGVLVHDGNKKVKVGKEFVLVD